jgi:ElaB/YqjD/DUF883 family membrane-anchored ribosome-binding protein
MDYRRRHARPPRDQSQDAATKPIGSVAARVQETVDGAPSTVDRAMEGLKQMQATVDGAKAAVEEVLERVNMVLKETVDGVKTAVERIEPAYATHNPWILLGSAIIMGYLLGTLERHTASAPGQGGSSAERHEPLGP